MTTHLIVGDVFRGVALTVALFSMAALWPLVMDWLRGDDDD